MTFTLRKPPLTAQPEPECGAQRAFPTPHDSYIPVIELSRSRRYCIATGGCTRKTYWVIRYPDLGPYAIQRTCWEHMTDTERAVFRAGY